MAALTTFTRKGLVFDVRDEGPRDAPVVILLHGFPEDSSSWDAVTPLLNARGYRTLAPDQRGYAPRARPADVADYATDELVADVLALADAAGTEGFHLVGHDWGGGVAWNAALAVPERIQSLTVLATPHPAALGEAFWSSTQLLKSWYMGLFQVPFLPERLLAGRVGALLQRDGLPRDVADHYTRRFATSEDLRGPINWYRAAVRGGLASSPGPASLVHVPTTYVWGNRDIALGRRAAERTERHVAAPYRFLELDATHWLPECEPLAVADAIADRIAATR